MGSDSKDVYVIIGATGGIGSALVRRLHQRGAKLVLAARDEEKLKRLTDEVDGEFMPGDAREISWVEDFISKAANDHGPITGIANCVGSILLKPAHMTSAEDWADTIALNLTSAFATVRAGAKVMLKTGGSLALVSTAAAQVGLVNHEAIAAAKAGVEGLTRAAAATYASKGIRVNAVAPGMVETPLTERLLKSDASRQASESMHPLGRVGQPDEVASALEWP